MQIFIWQHKPSMHQLALIKALKKEVSVTWIVEEKELSLERKKMGWETNLEPDFYLNDFTESVLFSNTINNGKVFHLFNGSRSSKKLRQIYLVLLKKEAKVFVQSEASNYFGLKGLLRILRGKWEANWERKKVAGVFAIGSLGEKYFTMIGYRKNQIKPFGYFIDLPTNNLVQEESQNFDSPFQILFVGRLIKTKGVHVLLDVLKTINGNWRLTIIGNGPLETQFKELVINNEHLEKRVSFLDFMSHPNILNIMKSSDLLVLPSVKKEGWGVVVNEALMQGVPVIVSNKCGSTVLLKNPIRGSVVKAGSHSELKKALIRNMDKGKPSIIEKENIQKWAQNSISGDVAADYLISVISGQKQAAPWRN